MKKNIFWILLSLSMFVLSGCGGGSDNISDSGNDTKTSLTAKVESKSNDNNVTDFFAIISFTKNVDASYKITLKDFIFSPEGCESVLSTLTFTPTTLDMNDNAGQYETVRIDGSFTENCTPVKYKLTATQVSTKDGQTDTRMYTVLYDPSNSGDTTDLVPSIGFFNASTPIQVSEPNQEHNITVQVVEDGYVVNGQLVKMQAFSSQYGDVTDYDVTTGTDGYAIFKYTSPAVLPSNGTTTTLTLTADTGDVNITQDIVLEFNQSPSLIDTSNMELTAAPNTININNPNESSELNLYLHNTISLKPIEGIMIEAKWFDPNNGTLNTYEIETNANGKAIFTYTAPASLPGTPLSITFDVKDPAASIAENVTVNFDGTTPGTDVNTTNMELIPVPDEINVTTPNEERTLSLYLYDTSTLTPLAGITLRANFFNPNNGELNSLTAETDVNGKAVFNYIAPATLPSSGSSFDITFDVENASSSIAQNVTVNFGGTSTPPVDTTNMELIAAPDEINITTPNTQKTLYLYLQDSSTSTPVQGISIKANFFNPNNGTLSSYTSETDTAGLATFNYVAPSTLPSTPLIITFDVENPTASIEENLTVHFIKSSYAFINTTDIEINSGYEKKDIKTQLTYGGVPVPGKTVEMLTFEDGNGSIINNYTVQTDELGYATFTYMAPETLDEVNNTTFTLTMQYKDDDLLLTTNANVTFISKPNEASDENTTLPIVVIPNDKEVIHITSNSQTVEIPVKVFKDITPYTEGSVKVELPAKVLNGTDVGKFESYEVAVDTNGIATFTYTGPSNLLALIAVDDNESIFKFYHLENSSGKKELKVLYEPSDPYISRHYELDINTDGNFSMGIPNKEKTFSIVLTARDGAGDEVALTDENITKITVLTTNSSVAQIFDSNTSMLVDSLDINPINNSSFILKSKTLSGLVPLQITVKFIDINGDPQVLSTTVNVRVFSGPPSAISISYVGAEQDKERAKYVEILAISVTDEWGNRVNTQPNVSLGAIVGYAVDGSEANGTETNETRRLFYGREDIDLGNADGTITPQGGNTAWFSDPINADVFQYVNAEGNNTDKLVVFGERKNYEAMGKWDMQLGGANNTLILQDNYYGIARSGLYYAVGHNYYQDQCRQDGREWIGTTSSDTYQLDEEGTVLIEYKYDYHLTGKDALIWVNLDGLQPDVNSTATTRVGEVTKHTLRGMGLTKVPTAGYTVPKYGAGYARFDIWHENAPEPYRNAHFAHAIEGGSTCAYQLVATSNAFDARTCDSTILVDMDNNATTPDIPFYGVNGRAYVTYYVQDTSGEGCTFDITDITVADEF